MSRKTVMRLAGYGLFFLLLTIVFTVANYPSENLTSSVNRWLSETSGDMLSVGRVSFRPLLSLKLDDINVDTGEVRQVLGDAKISPLLLPLLTGNRAVRGKLDGPWISSRFKVRSRGDGWNLEVPSLDADLESLPLPEAAQVKLVGVVEAVLNLNTPDSENVRLEGQGQLTGTDIEASGSILEALGLSPLDFPSLSIFFTIQDNVLTINENSLTGDISATARGTVRLMPSRPLDSRLDLTLEIKPGAKAKERLSPLFSLIGARQRANGSVVLRIRGTIDRPSVIS